MILSLLYYVTSYTESQLNELCSDRLICKGIRKVVMHLSYVRIYIHVLLFHRPQIRRDYPLNLSISLSGGKETNKDFHGSGERPGISPTSNPVLFTGIGKCDV